jgi:small-conductance mechanosensitive channel
VVLLTRWGEKKADDASAKTAIGAMGCMGKLVIWSVILILSLQNLGVNVSTLLAVGGVGGIAIALAVQGLLKDLFASISILLDKPFQVGDFIIVQDMMGTVVHIGLKTTRVKALSGEQIVFANDDLLGARIRNFKQMQERRIVFKVGVTYQTPVDKVEAIPGMIRGIVEAQPKLRFDRCHFQALGPYSLDFETVYIMQDPDYARYMDTQQAINLALMRTFEAKGIEFAYPTQTLIVEKPPGAA